MLIIAKLSIIEHARIATFLITLKSRTDTEKMSHIFIKPCTWSESWTLESGGDK